MLSSFVRVACCFLVCAAVGPYGMPTVFLALLFLPLPRVVLSLLFFFDAVFQRSSPRFTSPPSTNFAMSSVMIQVIVFSMMAVKSVPTSVFCFLNLFVAWDLPKSGIRYLSNSDAESSSAKTARRVRVVFLLVCGTQPASGWLTICPVPAFVFVLGIHFRLRLIRTLSRRGCRSNEHPISILVSWRSSWVRVQIHSSRCPVVSLVLVSCCSSSFMSLVSANHLHSQTRALPSKTRTSAVD